MINKEKRLELTDISHLTDFYQNLENANELYFKPKIKFKHLGGSWEISQFLCSWKERNKEAVIVLDNQLKIDNLDFKSELLLIAFFLSKKVICKNDKRDYLLSKFIPFVRNMNSSTLEEYIKGCEPREIKFLCLGGAKNEYLRLFYDGKSFKNKTHVENLIENLFISHNSAIKNEAFPLQKLKEIKEIVYEAFNNTDKHGSRDIEGEKISKSIRSLDISIVDMNEKNKIPFVEKNKDYEEFLENVKQLLVISIFDNGEGIVKKYIETTSDKKESQMSFEDKKKTLEKVFLPKISSSKTPNSGMGLTYLKECVKKLQGMLSISTSSLKLNLIPKKHGYSEEIMEVSPRSGTLITVLIPIKYRKRS